MKISRSVVLLFCVYVFVSSAYASTASRRLASTAFRALAISGTAALIQSSGKPTIAQTQPTLHRRSSMMNPTIPRCRLAPADGKLTLGPEDASQSLYNLVKLGFRQRNFTGAATLLNSGADPNYRPTPKSPSILLMLSKMNSPDFDDESGADMIDFLVNKGASVNADSNQSPLIESIANGRIAMVKRLLEAGSSIKFVDDQGRTPLGTAYKMDRPELLLEIVRALIKEGDLNASEQVLVVRSMVHLGPHLIESEKWLKKFEPTPQRNTLGQTAVHLLCKLSQNGSISEAANQEALAQYLSLGGDPNVADQKGITPIQTVLTSGRSVGDQWQLLKILFDHGARVAGNVQSSEKHPLSLAIESYHEDRALIRLIWESMTEEERKRFIPATDLQKEEVEILWRSEGLEPPTCAPCELKKVCSGGR